MRADRGWDVLLIGGGGGVGKTEVAVRIGARLATATLQADDIRLVLQRALPATATADLHFFLDADITAVELRDAVERQLSIGRFVSGMLEIVIRHHVSTRRRVIIEGDALLPELALQPSHAGLPTAGRIRAVFVEERDPERVLGALQQRRRGPAPEREQRHWAEFHHAHGRALADRARALGVPVVAASPRRNLAARIMSAAGISG